MDQHHQFTIWGQAYFSHCRDCENGCNRYLPRCAQGYENLSRSVSVGPVLAFRMHELTCKTCGCTPLNLCPIGKALLRQIEDFIRYISPV